MVDAYINKVNRVKLFCQYAQDGFVIIEVNDLLSKAKIINDISDGNKLHYLDMSTMSVFQGISTQKSVYILDTLAFTVNDIDHRKLALDINYNRDLFLKLGCVVFICTTKLVNELISFSNSFWSFVSIHVEFNKKLDSIFSPFYIEEQSNFFYRHDQLELKSLKTYHEQIKKIVNVDSIKKLDKLLENFWNDCLDILEFYRIVLVLGDEFCRIKKHKYAERCYIAFLYKSRKYGGNIRLELDILNSLASVSYHLHEYKLAVFYLNEMQTISERSNNVLSNYELSALWNNIGILLLKDGIYDLSQSISCINHSLQLINYDEIRIQHSKILYNACLVNYMFGDYNQCKYYIDLATQYTNSDSRTRNIVSHRLSILKCFIRLNEGDYNDIIATMTDNLMCLRKELDEEHEYVFEAHYTFALIYMHLNMIENANRCITKALRCVKNSKSEYINNKVKVCVWGLYGIIKYYCGELIEAKNYLSLAYHQSDKIDNNMITCVEDILKRIN